MTVPTPPAVSEAMREAVATFARAAAGLPASVSDQAPVARISADASHPGTITTITAGDLRAIASEIARLTGERDELASFKTEASAVLLEWEAVSDKCADLITRQGSEIARLHAAEAETARLRAALEEIAKGAPVTEPHPWDGELDTVCWNTAQIARAALTSQEKTDD